MTFESTKEYEAWLKKTYGKQEVKAEPKPTVDQVKPATKK